MLKEMEYQQTYLDGLKSQYFTVDKTPKGIVHLPRFRGVQQFSSFIPFFLELFKWSRHWQGHPDFE